ncbi:MAG: hypothetical protein KDA81_17935 [Planctomycetaceae bacterium]|nr:hypothetical protein [Planctomycetaceae bacterium]
MPNAVFLLGMVGVAALFGTLPTYAGPADIPVTAKLRENLSSSAVQVYGLERKLWLHVQSEALPAGKVTIPRLCAPMKSMRWLDASDAEIKFVPEPQEWVFSWKQAPNQSPIIEVDFDIAPLLPKDCPTAAAAGDGSVLLHAWQAATFGEKLRFEPQWFKNTVGYWTVPTDYAEWNFVADQPGTFTVAVLQGCGAGQGGSVVVASVRTATDEVDRLSFQTIDTGHFQNFRWNHLGTVTIPAAGSYQLRLTPGKIAKAAVFDVRMVHLVRQARAVE